VRAFIQPLIDLFQDAIALGKDRDQLSQAAFAQGAPSDPGSFDELLLKSQSRASGLFAVNLAALVKHV